MDYTNILAKYVADLRWDDIPDNVISRSKINILDTLGVALRGSQTKHAQAAFQTINKLGGAPQSSVIGHGTAFNVTQAAFLNALSAHSVDFDDAHKFVHPGCVVIPAALCMTKCLNYRVKILSLL
jgi:2-methylcitrate dehydratase PrpD